MIYEADAEVPYVGVAPWLRTQASQALANLERALAGEASIATGLALSSPTYEDGIAATDESNQMLDRVLDRVNESRGAIVRIPTQSVGVFNKVDGVNTPSPNVSDVLRRYGPEFTANYQGVYMELRAAVAGALGVPRRAARCRGCPLGAPRGVPPLPRDERTAGRGMSRLRARRVL